MDEEHVEYSILSAVQHRSFDNFYRKICETVSKNIYDPINSEPSHCRLKRYMTLESSKIRQ